MSDFDLPRASDLAAGNPKVDLAQLRQLDDALTALDQAGVKGMPSYGIASPYGWRRLETSQKKKTSDSN